jgi:hypothetical protein
MAPTTLTIFPTLKWPPLSAFDNQPQSLYNISQLQCSELDPVGAFHFVALDIRRFEQPPPKHHHYHYPCIGSCSPHDQNADKTCRISQCPNVRTLRLRHERVHKMGNSTYLHSCSNYGQSRPRQRCSHQRYKRRCNLVAVLQTAR